MPLSFSMIKLKHIQHIYFIVIGILVLFAFSKLYTPNVTEYLQNRNVNIHYQMVQKEVKLQFIRQVNCMAQNIYYEARGETYQGKLAVTQVVLNRVRSGLFPDSVCGVVYQRNNNGCQFSWVCQKHNKPIDHYEWQESVEIARRALTEQVVYAKLAKTDALYYHANYVSPDWANSMKVVAVIGKHIFYRP